MKIRKKAQQRKRVKAKEADWGLFWKQLHQNNPQSVEIVIGCHRFVAGYASDILVFKPTPAT